MITLAGALSGIAVGLALALALNLELLGNVFATRRLDAGRGLAPSDREQILQWMRRSLLVALPLVFGFIGLASADDLFGGTV